MVKHINAVITQTCRVRDRPPIHRLIQTWQLHFLQWEGSKCARTDGHTDGRTAEGPGSGPTSQTSIQQFQVEAQMRSEGRLPQRSLALRRWLQLLTPCRQGRAHFRGSWVTTKPPTCPDPPRLALCSQKHSPTWPSPCTPKHRVARSGLPKQPTATLCAVSTHQSGCPGTGAPVLGARGGRKGRNSDMDASRPLTCCELPGLQTEHSAAG